MMHILGTLFVGLIVGLIARMLHPGKDNMGLIITGVLGVAGSFLAEFAGQALKFYKEGQSAGWIASIVGALVLLVIYGFVAKKV